MQLLAKWTGKLLVLALGVGTLVASVSAQPMPEVSVGRIERLDAFPSRHVDARHVDIWLPQGYTSQQRYNVVYMHDGQMLFDARTTWNKKAWNVHLTVQRLIDQGLIAPTIVVGVWNNDRFRHSEYFPQKFLSNLSTVTRKRFVHEALQDKPQADNYLRFLVEELKPVIDSKFSTRPDVAHTFVMGSSMGGLISVYAMNEYPQVFGGAAGLSTHWVGSFQANADIPLAAFMYLRDHLADPKHHRLYQDHGTIELDALYAPYQMFVDQLARDRGYTDDNYLSRVFEGTGHDEVAWANRLDIPLLFLMGRR